MATVADIVGANVARLRAYRALSLRMLSERLDALQYPMLASVISKIELGERKVNVTDLMALALALNVSPVRLLLPGVDERDESSPEVLLSPGGDPVTLAGNVAVPWAQAWRWVTGDEPLDDSSPDDLVRWLRLNRPHDDAAAVAAWVAALEQTAGWEVERDECGRPTYVVGPNSRPDGPPVRTQVPASLPALTLNRGAGVARGERPEAP